MKKPRNPLRLWKERIKVLDEETQNPYYETISRHLGSAQVLLYLSLFAFVLIALISNSKLITYQNFYHFFQDLNASVLSAEVFSQESLTYPTADQQSFALYRRGLAVAGNHSITLFSPSGRQTLSKNLDSYRNPVMEGTGKYVLVYELGGTRYSLYNLQTQMHTGKTEYPITGAAVSDSGMFALISSSESYNSVVTLYNERFAMINRYSKNGYVMDVDINEKGSLLTLLTSSAAGERFNTVLEIYRVGGETAQASIALSGALGLDCSFSAASTVIAICSDGVFFIDENGAQKASYSFGDASLVAFDVGKDGLAIALEHSELLPNDSLLLFDKHGKQLFEMELSVRAEQLALYEESVFVLHPEGIVCYTAKGSAAGAWQGMTDGKKMLAIAEDEILLCSPQKATYLRLAP